MSNNTTFNTFYVRRKDGWHGKSLVQLSASLEGKVLSFSTGKSSESGGCLATSITCLLPTGIEGMLQFPLYGGFSKRIVTHPKRVTEKLVREQHERALSMLDDFVKEAIEFFLVPKAQAA